jgi:hypothetical protein
MKQEGGGPLDRPPTTNPHRDYKLRRELGLSWGAVSKKQNPA